MSILACCQLFILCGQCSRCCFEGRGQSNIDQPWTKGDKICAVVSLLVIGAIVGGCLYGLGPLMDLNSQLSNKNENNMSCVDICGVTNYIQQGENQCCSNDQSSCKTKTQCKNNQLAVQLIGIICCLIGAGLGCIFILVILYRLATIPKDDNKTSNKIDKSSLLTGTTHSNDSISGRNPIYPRLNQIEEVQKRQCVICSKQIQNGVMRTICCANYFHQNCLNKIKRNDKMCSICFSIFRYKYIT